MFSQSNEDEIIEAIFREIGTTNKRFIEFGCGDGSQNNTINLLLNGWSGIWLEPRQKRTDSARKLWADYPVEIFRKAVTPANVDGLVSDPLDFLSIDIDGNDHAVWKAINSRPRVVCIEYWANGGSPLKAMKKLGEEKGYDYHGCSASQVNAFFVLPDAPKR